MVALMKNNMKKSTISARSLWRGEGMLYSRPCEKEKKSKAEVKQVQKIINRSATTTSREAFTRFWKQVAWICSHKSIW